MSKRILSMLLAIVMVVGMMHGMSITANAAPSVSTSNNGTVLTISGTGILNRNYLDGVNKGKVTTIIIGEGITEIAGTTYQYRNWSTFSGFSNVTTITIEGDLESVGNYAFSGCSRLITINYQGTKVPSGSKAGIIDGVTINVPAGYNSDTFGGKTVAKPHTHTWNYSVNRTTITATCSDWSCRQAGGSVTISAPSDLIYDGNDKNATLAFSRDWALDEAAKPDITYNSVNRTNVTGSEISASISLGGKTASVRYTIAPKDLTDEQVEIALEKDQYGYTGEYIKPAVISVKLNGQPLNSGDYSVGYANNKNASDKAKVIVTFQGNYSGEARKTFTIEKAKGEINLIAPVESVLPGTTILLTVESNAENFENLEFSGEGFEIVGEAVEIEGGWKIKTKIDEDLVIGENDKVNICVAYKDTANYTGNDELSLKVGMSGSSVDEEALKALKDDIDELRNLIAKKADAKEIADQLKAITEQIAKLDASHATKAELEKAITDVTAACNNALEDAVKDLEEKITAQIDPTELAAAIKNVTDLIDALDDTYATDAALAKAIEDVTAACNKALEDAVKDLEEKITAQIDPTELAAAIKNVTDLIDALDDTYATDAALEKAITDVTAACNTALENAVKDLEEKIAAQIDPTELAAAIKSVTDLIDALDDTYATDAALAKAIEDVTAACNTALENAVKDLEEKIAAQIDPTELAAAIKNVTDLIDALDETYASDAELQTKIAEANALITSLTDRVTNAETAIEELEKAIADLNKAITDGDQELSDEIDALSEALEAAKAELNQADATNKEYLEGKITEAQNSLQAAIDAVQENLDQAIEDLKEADADNAANLEKAINRLNKAIEDAKAAAKDADARLERKLNKKIEDADKALHQKIDAVQKNLNKAKEDLAKAIAAGDKNLHDRITRLNDAMNAADTALKAADEALKKQLETEIKAANDLIDSLASRMDTAEDAIAVLDKAVEELKAADVANTEAMKAAIENLNKAIKGVKEFAEKSDAETKAALNEKINAAQTALEAKIAEIQANLDKAVEELKAADQANAEKLADAIARLKEAIAVAEAASAATDAVQDEHIIALKNEINRVAIDLEKAQANLEAALKAEIEALTSELKRAEEALKNAIDTKADEDAVNAAIAELQNEIAALEAAKNNYIAADAALKAEVEAAIAKAKQEAIEAAKGHIPYIGENGNWWIGNSDTGVDANGIQGETGKDGITPKLRVGSGNIWEVSYDNGKTWTSLGVSAVGASGSNGRNGRDGKDGVDGKDGITPQLRINEDTNMWEISYDEGKTWESLGVVATGADGADGANGADGITPQLRINEKTNMWEVSYDEGATWTSMGVKATGADGSSNVLPLVISGISLAGMIAMICIMLVDRKKRGLPVG